MLPQTTLIDPYGQAPEDDGTDGEEEFDDVEEEESEDEESDGENEMVVLDPDHVSVFIYFSRAD